MASMPGATFTAGCRCRQSRMVRLKTAHVGEQLSSCVASTPSSIPPDLSYPCVSCRVPLLQHRLKTSHLQRRKPRTCRCACCGTYDIQHDNHACSAITSPHEASPGVTAPDAHQTPHSMPAEAAAATACTDGDASVDDSGCHKPTADISKSTLKASSNVHEDDIKFMVAAVEQAKIAASLQEVPVGAVIVVDGVVIAEGFNQTRTRQDPTAHAELICIQQAAKQLQNWRLNQATIYITTEPCPMCAGAILQARLAAVVYGARQPRIGADGSWIHMLRSPVPSDLGEAVTQAMQPHPFHPNLEVRAGVMEDECSQLIKDFFKRRRMHPSGPVTVNIVKDEGGDAKVPKQDESSPVLAGL